MPGSTSGAAQGSALAKSKAPSRKDGAEGSMCGVSDSAGRAPQVRRRLSPPVPACPNPPPTLTQKTPQNLPPKTS